jgi:DNA-binding winged helix-turn-helix (wHTH) protein
MNMGLAVKQDSRAGAVHSSAHDRAKTQARCLCFGAFQLDLQQRQLSKDGLPVKVQGKVYQALVMLIETPGETVTREALRMRLWPRDTQLDYDANVNTTVNKLRQVLGDTNEQSKYIETIPRKGYSFVAKIEYVDAPAPPSASTQGAAERKDSIWSFAGPRRFLRSDAANVWFTASVIVLMMAAVLLGAAITLYSHRSIQPAVVAPPSQTTPPTGRP